MIFQLQQKDAIKRCRFPEAFKKWCKLLVAPKADNSQGMSLLQVPQRCTVWTLIFFSGGEPPGYSKLGMWSGMVMPLSMDLCGLPESKRMEPAVVLVHDMWVSKSERFPMPSKKWLITQHYAYMTIFHNSTTRIVYGNSLVFSVMFGLTPWCPPSPITSPMCFAMFRDGNCRRRKSQSSKQDDAPPSRSGSDYQSHMLLEVTWTDGK